MNIKEIKSVEDYEKFIKICDESILLDLAFECYCFLRKNQSFKANSNILKIMNQVNQINDTKVTPDLLFYTIAMEYTCRQFKDF